MNVQAIGVEGDMPVLLDVADGPATLDDNEEVYAMEQSVDAETFRFDITVGCLEEILMNDEFVTMQEDFLTAHCDEFEDVDENKLSYTDIFNKYTEMIEQYLEEQLQSNDGGLNMAEFCSMLERRKDEITSDVFDILTSMADFEEFKSLMLSHKNSMSSPGLANMELVGVQQVDMNPDDK
eukprot:CAMPEP_0113939788 /NCGR_PEP_ID=MMETSP1339-20121228/6046_1 /TAXON_ID=94617 /ORGANISM="Fibrocapsa japonica" /LENGTH=179 /DNA_ID=CAMNT_0000943401 /DNA_START=68 /DNA_END=607 /DNA_ORIENTATION=- /assembly_acc=CAM_ASM_000762